jgi:hypothetical protein
MPPRSEGKAAGNGTGVAETNFQYPQSVTAHASAEMHFCQKDLKARLAADEFQQGISLDP